MAVQITTAAIRQLRDKTGAGVMDVKRALESSGGDMEVAEVSLREKGLAAALKRAGKLASEGVVNAYIHQGGRIGAMVELNCETDFVARTDEFQNAAHNIAMQVAAMAPNFVDHENVPSDLNDVTDDQLLMEQDYIRDPSVKVRDLIMQLSAKTGEKVQISRFTRFELGQ